MVLGPLPYVYTSGLSYQLQQRVVAVMASYYRPEVIYQRELHLHLLLDFDCRTLRRCGCSFQTVSVPSIAMIEELMDSMHLQLPHLASRIGALAQSKAIVYPLGTLYLVDSDCYLVYYEQSCYTKPSAAELVPAAAFALYSN